MLPLFLKKFLALNNLTVDYERSKILENEKKIGIVTHFYPKINVAVIELTDEIKNGDTIIFRGSTTSLEQIVESMQIQHEKVEKVTANQSIGLKVKDMVRVNDIVYKKTV